MIKIGQTVKDVIEQFASIIDYDYVIERVNSFDLLNEKVNAVKLNISVRYKSLTLRIVTENFYLIEYHKNDFTNVYMACEYCYIEEISKK